MKKKGCKRCDDDWDIKVSPYNLSTGYDSERSTRARENERWHRLQILPFAMELAGGIAEKAKRTGRVQVGRVTSDDVVHHAERLWAFVNGDKTKA